MKKQIGVLIAIFMLISILTGCSKIIGKKEPKFGDDYIKYETQEGGYSVLLPGEPKRESDSYSSPAGKMEYSACIYTKDSCEYAVGYIDFPEAIFEKVGKDKLLQSMKTETAKSDKGKLINETKITIDKYQGIEQKIESEDGKKIAINRMFFAGKRMYMIGVEKPKGQENEQDVSFVLDSFKLINK